MHFFIVLALVAVSSVYADCNLPEQTNILDTISSSQGIQGAETFLFKDFYYHLYVTCRGSNVVLAIRHQFYGTLYSPETGVTGFGVNQYGQMVLRTKSGTKTYGIKREAGRYELLFDRDYQYHLVIKDSGDKVVWDFASSWLRSDWGLRFALGKGMAEAADLIEAYRDNNKIVLYFLDSTEGLTSESTDHSLRLSLLFMNELQENIGIALYNNTNDSTSATTFNEPNFVEGIRRAITKSSDIYPGYTNIINFSGVFDDGNSKVANCAIQWAFKKGFYFIAAAGNENKLISAKNPYQFLVGAAEFNYTKAGAIDYTKTPAIKANVWSQSNYGPALDIWGPSQIGNMISKGTSLATSFVSGIAYYAIIKNPSLAFNPGLGYEYFKQMARTDILNASDPKSMNSPNAQNRYISGLKFNTPPGKTVPKANVDYCAGLNLPSSNPSQQNWDQLMKKANASALGHFVGTTSTSLCGCAKLFCRC